MKQVLGLMVLVAMLSGCSTYSTNRYSISVDNVAALRTLNGKTINVGDFSSSVPGQSEIMCPVIVPVKTRDGEPFSEFIRKALIDELRMANVFSPTAPTTLTGHLNKIDFSSTAGNWNLVLTIKSSNGRSMVVTETYLYNTNILFGDDSCDDAAQAFVPAIQDLIGKIVRSPDFIALISE